MSLLQEVIQDSLKRRPSFRPIKKDDYDAQRKSEEAVWASVDQQTGIVFSSNAELLNFLKAQARLHYISANNILFLQTQRPHESTDPSMLKTFAQWNGMGRRIRKSEKHLKLIDGYGRSFNIKQVYDISQVMGDPISPQYLARDQEIMLAAMVNALHNKKIGINIDNMVPAELGGLFEDGVITMRDDLPFEKTVFGLALAAIAAERDLTYRRSSSIEICSAIIFCEASGIPIEHDESIDLLLTIVNTDTQDLPDIRERRRVLEYSQKNAKTIFDEITKEALQIRSELKQRVVSSASPIEKSQSNSEKEVEKSRLVAMLKELVAAYKDVVPNHTGYVDDSWLNYLSRDEAVVALRSGIPIGIRSKYAHYHGIHKGDYSYDLIPNEAMLDKQLSNKSNQDRISIHDSLPKDVQDKIKSYLNRIIELEAEASCPPKSSAPKSAQMVNGRKEQEYAMEM